MEDERSDAEMITGSLKRRWEFAAIFERHFDETDATRHVRSHVIVRGGRQDQRAGPALVRVFALARSCDRRKEAGRIGISICAEGGGLWAKAGVCYPVRPASELRFAMPFRSRAWASATCSRSGVSGY